jgi:hypothetical protein
LTLLKGIVAALVLANVAYFLWSNGIAKTPDAVVVGPGTLKLASESVAAGVTRNTPPAATAAVPEDGAAANLDSSAAPAVASGVVAAAASEDAADAPDAAAQSLLSNVKRCVSVGPFRDVSEAARAAGTLRSGGYDPRQRVADGEVWAGVWVYLPLPAAQPAAQQILAKLKGGGIDDALEMPGPNDTSVISLGLFSEPKRAQARVAQAQALSLNPAIADRKRIGSVYWIDIDLKPTDRMLNPGDLQGEAGRIVRLEVKGCPSAAAGSR